MGQFGGKEQHEFKFRLSIVIEDVVVTCKYVTTTQCAASNGRYKLNYVFAGYKPF